MLAPMVARKEPPPRKTTADRETRILRFRAAHDFDIGQTGGEPLPEFARVKGAPREFTARLKEAISARGITLDYSGKIAPAKGVSAGGAITVLPGTGPAE